MCRVICIDDANRPKEIPKKKWITKKQEYTVIWITVHPLQEGIQGIQLAEISLDDDCHPYSSYRMSRFAIHKDDIEEFKQLMKDCSGMDDVVIEELIKKENLEIIENE